MATLTIADLDNGKRDLQTVDAVANSQADTTTTRYGQQTLTLAGALKGLGYKPPVPYAPGLSVASPLFTVSYAGSNYAPVEGAAPFTAGAWNPAQWRLLQADGNLRSDLASPGGAMRVGFGQSTVDATLVQLDSTKADRSELSAAIGTISTGAPEGYLGSLASLNSDPSVDQRKLYVILNAGDAANYGKVAAFNGTAWIAGPVYQNSVLSANSVKVENLGAGVRDHLTSLPAGTWESEVESGFYNTTSGIPRADPLWLRSKGFIPVKSGEALAADYVQLSGTLNRVDFVFYDSSGAFVSSSTSSPIAVVPGSATLACVNLSFTASIDPSAVPLIGVQNLRGALSKNTGLVAVQLTLNWMPGYVRESGIPAPGEEGVSGYRYSHVALRKGDGLLIKGVKANAGTAVLSVQSGASLLPVVSGVKSFSDFTYIAPSDCTVFLSSATTGGVLPEVTVAPAYLQSESRKNLSGAYSYQGYVSLTGELTSSGVYSSSGLIALRRGEILNVFAAGSGSVSVITKYDQNAAFVANISVGGSTNAHFYSYVAASDVEFVRVSSRTSDITPRVEIKSPNHLTGKTFGMLGDSYVRGNATHANVVSYNQVAVSNGMVFTNYGQNGNTVSGVQADGMVVRYADMADDLDYVGFEGGRNDFSAAVPMGENDSTDPLTFKGALNVLCAGLIAKYPGKKLFGVNCWNVSDAQNAYARAFVEIASGRWAIPVYDANLNSGVSMRSPEFRAIYCETPGDISHLNEAGHSFFASKLEAFIRSI